MRKPGHGQGNGAAQGTLASNPHPGLPMAAVPLAPWKIQGKREPTTVPVRRGLQARPAGGAGVLTRAVASYLHPTIPTPRPTSQHPTPAKAHGHSGWRRLEAGVVSHSTVSHCGPPVDSPHPWTLGRLQLPLGGSGAPRGPSPAPEAAISSGQSNYTQGRFPEAPLRPEPSGPLKDRARGCRSPGIGTPSPSLCHSKEEPSPDRGGLHARIL